MRLFFVKPGINALGQPLGITLTVDNLFDMIFVAALGGILLLGMAVALTFFVGCATSAPPSGYPASAQYQAM
ncbi:MAG: hypothetical protein U0105_13385 [Candidatus Obscuribacterales bacterium]|jgi:hypothetical protein